MVRGWLTKALTASRGPQWVCSKCQQVHPAWGPVCENCGSFDTMGWTTPAKVDVAMPSGTEMLPLIVGQLAKSDDTATDDPANDPDVIVVELDDDIIDVDAREPAKTAAK